MGNLARTKKRALAVRTPGLLAAAAGAGFMPRRRLTELPYREVLTSFAGSTVNQGGGSAIDLADSDHFGGGTSCARMTTDGASGNCYFSTPVLAAGDAVDLTNGIMLIAMKSENRALLSSTPWSIYASSDAAPNTYTNNVRWNPPEPGGVSLNAYNRPDNEWILVPLYLANVTSTGAPDLTAMRQFRVRLASSSGTPTTVRIGGILLAKNAYARHPNGVIALTFDDGRSGQHAYGRPILNQRGIRGTFYIVDGYLGSDSANYMSLAQVQQLRTDGHEVGYHAATGAAHGSGYPDLGPAAAVADLRTSFANHLAWGLQAAGEPKHLAWPKGEWDDASYAAVSALGFTSMRLTGGDATHMEAFPPVSRLKIVSASSSAALTSLALMQAWADAVKAQKTFGVLALHQINSNVTSSNGTNWKDLETFIDYCIAAGIAFASIGEATEALVRS